MENEPGLIFHHVGCLTRNIAQSVLFYKEQLGFRHISEVIGIASQQVKVCFIETGPGIFLELIEPVGDNAALGKMLKNNNPYYHIAYRVNDMGTMIEKLQKAGCYLVNRFFSEAFGNKECAFMYTPEMQLLELIETGG